MKRGFIKIHRQIIEWEWYKDTPVKCVFLHLLLTASYKDYVWRDEKLKAGQVPGGRKALAEATGLSEQQVRRALDILEKTGEISRKRTNKYTVATIENWALYQSQNVDATNKQPHYKNTRIIYNLKRYMSNLQSKTKRR